MRDSLKAAGRAVFLLRPTPPPGDPTDTFGLLLRCALDNPHLPYAAMGVILSLYTGIIILPSREWARADQIFAAAGIPNKF